MGIGAIGGVMTANYNPYVYNTNSVSSASLDRVKPVSGDLSESRVDFSELLKNNTVENINPLKPGQSSNFADILMSQMSIGALRQSELLATNP